jgi:hypothetical protein
MDTDYSLALIEFIPSFEVVEEGEEATVWN